MMRRIWMFVRSPQNLAVVVALGSAAAFLWNELGTSSKASDKTSSDPTIQVARAEGGAVAVTASGSARVNINGRDIASRSGAADASKPASRP